MGVMVTSRLSEIEFFQDHNDCDAGPAGEDRRVIIRERSIVGLRVLEASGLMKEGQAKSYGLIEELRPEDVEAYNGDKR